MLPATHGSRSRAAASLALLHCFITVLQPSKTVAAWAETFRNVSWSKQLSAVSASMVGVMASKAGQTPLTMPPESLKMLSLYLLLKDFSFDSQSVMVLLV